MNTLSELSSYVYLLGNDARILHLYTEGENFMSIHELLQDLYEVCFEYYDTFAEMAISHGESIPNPSDIVLSEGIDWNPTFGDAFDTNFIIDEVKEKGKTATFKVIDNDTKNKPDDWIENPNTGR